MNLVVVATLTAIAIAFLSGRPRLVRPAMLWFTVLGLADWVLVQDLGFLGGIGTDPNSMIPFILLAASGYLALKPGPGVPAAEPDPWLADAVLRTHRAGDRQPDPFGQKRLSGVSIQPADSRSGPGAAPILHAGRILHVNPGSAARAPPKDSIFPNGQWCYLVVTRNRDPWVMSPSASGAGSPRSRPSRARAPR